MAFIQANFAPVGGQAQRGNAPQVFTYKTTDSIATCNTDKYFNGGSTAAYAYKGIYNMVELGDIIDIVVVNSLSAPTSVSAVSRVIVNGKSSGFVDVTDGQLVTTVDSD